MLYIKNNRSGGYLQSFSELVGHAEEQFQELGLDFLFI